MTTESPIGHAYATTLDYLDRAEAYLAGHANCTPDANLLRRDQPLPEGAILSARSGEDQYGPFIGVKIEHNGEDHESRPHSLSFLICAAGSKGDQGSS